MYSIIEPTAVIAFWLILYIINHLFSKNRAKYTAKKSYDRSFVDRSLLTSCVNIILFLSLFLSLINEIGSTEKKFNFAEIQSVALGFIIIVVVHLYIIKEKR